MRPQALRGLHQTAAEATGGAHDERPVASLEIGLKALAERQRKMPRDDRRFGERQPFGQRDAIDGRDLDVLRVSTPALDAQHPPTRAAALVASGAVLAATTPDPAEDRHPVTDFHGVDLGTRRGDHSRRIVAQDER